MSKVIFINRYFYPDLSATSQILSELAFALAAKGQAVHVITSQQLYENPTTRLAPEETANGVKIHRVRTTRFGRSRLLGRTLDYISFYFSVRWTLASIASPNDIVIAKTDPPLLSLAVMSAVKRRRARLVNWLQDLCSGSRNRLGHLVAERPNRRCAAIFAGPLAQSGERQRGGWRAHGGAPYFPANSAREDPFHSKLCGQ